VSRQRSPSAVSKARNSFRQFFNARKDEPYWKEMQAVRLQISPPDYPTIHAITEGNRYYPFPGLGNTFPSDEWRVPNLRFSKLTVLQGTREVALQVSRLNHHGSRLAKALKSLAQINWHLARHELDEVEAAIAAHKDAYGFSLVLAKKEFLSALERQGLSGLTRRYKALIGSHNNTAWALMCHYFYDMADPTFDPSRSARAWLAAAQQPPAREWYCTILEDEVLTRSRNDSGLASTFLRYSGCSLLDLLILVWRKKAAHPDDQHMQRAFRQLDELLKALLIENFTELRVHIAGAYRLFDKSPPDVEVYRTSFFFDDIASVATWRCQVTRLVFDGIFKISSVDQDRASSSLDAAAAAIAATPQQCREVIESLTNWETGFLVPGTALANQDFLTAVVVAESLRVMQRRGSADTEAIAYLLASTEDVQLYVSMDTFDLLLNDAPARSSPLLRFVLRDMLYRKERSQDNELERRIAFMEMFHGHERASIVELLDEIASTSLDTAKLLARTCTRTFLERLYLMMTSVKDVLETRLGICRWFGSHVEEPDDSLKEEGEALERELANLDARSDLDSTRVHVDEDSLHEWFNNTQLPNANRYIQTVLAEDPESTFGSMLTFYSNKEKATSDEEDFTADTQIGSEFLLLGIFDATFKVFASDRTFGLDAYLSRRIRHGSLSGQILTPVNRVLRRLSEVGGLDQQLQEPSGATRLELLANEWRSFLTRELDHIRKDIIQVKTSSNDTGLIQATWRTAANIAHLDAMIARVRSRVIDTEGAYDIFPDIFSLCWDCLESDLAQLRLYMARTFLPLATERLNYLFEELSYDDRIRAGGV
jgi:hypothetical protein